MQGSKRNTDVKNKLLDLCGKNVFPLFEGGRGVNVSNGHTAGAWAKENCVGTFSAVFPDVKDELGNLKSPDILSKSRNERHAEMMEKAIEGCESSFSPHPGPPRWSRAPAWILAHLPVPTFAPWLGFSAQQPKRSHEICNQSITLFCLNKARQWAHTIPSEPR